MSVRDGQTDTVTRLLTDTINGTIQQEQNIYIRQSQQRKRNNNKYKNLNNIALNFYCATSNVRLQFQNELIVQVEIHAKYSLRS